MSSPAVSIVMRTKDRQVLLTRAIADVARQQWRDWELLIVNDGGQPEPVDALLAQHAAALDGRARVIHNPSSTGMEHASNQAISQARGRYICIHDDDDTWDPAFLQTCVDYLESHPEHAAVVTRIEIVLEKLTAAGVIEQGREQAWPDIHQFSLSELMIHNIAVPIGCMYRASVIEELGGFRDDLPVVGDWEFHLRLAVAHDVGFIDGKPLAFWHQRRTQGGVLGNSVFAGADDHHYFDLKVRDEYLREFAREHGIGSLLFIASMTARHGGFAGGETAFNFVRRKARQAIFYWRSRRQASSQRSRPPAGS